MATEPSRRRLVMGAGATIVALIAGTTATAQDKQDQPDFPPFAEVSKDYTKVVSTADGAASLYTLYVREKDGQMLAELPRNFDRQKLFIALTIPTGDQWAGLQAGDMYVYWKRIDKRLALMEPNLAYRSTGDQASKDAIARHYTDRVVLDVPIVCMGPGGGPVIDMDALLVGQAEKFYGGLASGIRSNLATIESAKAFPENVEISITAPSGNGVMKTFHYSISEMKENPSYKPRVADERVGYFVTNFVDLGKYNNVDKWIRYINRWHIEKADPSLKLSPPKNPIVFYIDHTVPVRYRRFVKDGILQWNKAFEQCGIKDAIEVYYQDKETGAHMDKDPEDVRYNFIRWLSNDISTAIGPSRVHPMTGEIKDADIVLTDGWIRVFWYQINELLPEMALEGFGPDTLAWLEKNPQWDPRVRLRSPAQAEDFLAARAARQAQRGIDRFGGFPMANVDTPFIGDEEYDGLVGRVSQLNGMCMASKGMAFNMALMRMHLEIADALAAEPVNGADEPDKGDKKDDKKDQGDTIDGVPEWFMGPALAHLVAHEVGHTLGLRHNFRASSVYTLAQINSEEMKGKKTWCASVMDYAPVNINMDPNRIQGDHQPIDIGPYDMWAIEYGYTFGDTKEVLKRVAEPELVYATDEDTSGPDPLARRYDMSANPLDYAKTQMALAQDIRSRLLDKFVKDGESWARARRGYGITLGQQMGALSTISRFIGGAYITRDRKGDPNARPPITVVPAATQREALAFVIENAFRDEAFGLTPEMLRYMTVDKWFDGGGSAMEDPTWPVHNQILGIQASALTMLMNPQTLQRVYDNEFRVPAGEDMITLPEVLFTVSDAVWSELDSKSDTRYSARQPMISSLRRNLQREHLERLIDLAMPGGLTGAAAKPVANLSTFKLRELQKKIGDLTEGSAASRLDPYTLAHLSEAKLRIDKALDASFIYNTNDFGSMNFGGFIPFGQPAAPATGAPGTGE